MFSSAKSQRWRGQRFASSWRCSKTGGSSRTNAVPAGETQVSAGVGVVERTSPDANGDAHDLGTGQVARSSTKADTVEHRPNRLEAAIVHTQAKAALTALGWKPTVAHAAVAAAAAVAAHREEWTLERLIFESLRRCPAPKA